MPERVQGVAVVCHPHPQYGGNRHDRVVQALFDSLPDIGVAVLRFDFRTEFGGGELEVLDLAAAIDAITAETADTPHRTVFAAGYSFGAMMALAVDHPALGGRVMIAPPLGAFEVSAGRDLPGLVLSPEHDQFCPPDRARPIVTGWPDTEFVAVPSTDHFLAGATGFVTDRVGAWISAQLSG